MSNSSLIKKGSVPALTATKFEAQKSETEFVEQKRLEFNAYQKKRRDILRQDYNEQKAISDSLSYSDLFKYIEDNKTNAHESRVGVVSLKCNYYEHSAFKLAVHNSGARSMRELFLKLVEDAGLLAEPE